MHRRFFSYGLVLLTIAFVWCLAAASCSKQGPTTEKKISDKPIRFTSSDVRASVSSKAGSHFDGDEVYDLLNAKGYGVSSVFVPREDDDPYTESTPDRSTYITNLPVNRSNAVLFYYDDTDVVDRYYWITSPTTYWPPDGHVSFFAYAPYRADATNNPESNFKLNDDFSTLHFPTITYTPETDAANQDDVLTGCAMDWDMSTESPSTGYSGDVDMTLYHQLSWITFEARAEISLDLHTWLDARLPGYKIGVTRIELSGIAGTNTGRYVLPAANPTGFVWDAIDPAVDANYDATYELSVEEGHLKDVSTANLPTSISHAEGYFKIVNGGNSEDTDLSGRLYLLPQTLSQTLSKLTVEFGVYRSNNELVILYQTTYDIGNLRDGLDQVVHNVWAPGKLVTYQMSLNMTDVSESTIVAHVEDWKEGKTTQHGSYLE